MLYWRRNHQLIAVHGQLVSVDCITNIVAVVTVACMAAQ